MRRRHPHKLMAVLASLIGIAAAILPSCSQKPDMTHSSETPAAVTPAAAPAKDSELLLPEVEGFVRGEINRFDDPRLGYSVAYDSPEGLAMTVYVYNGGRADIGDGLSDPARAEFTHAKMDIFASVKDGGWLSITTLQDEEEVSAGDGPGAPRMLHASFKLGTERGEALSDLYITGDRGNFFKIRCTYPAAAQRECEEARAKILKVLGAALRAAKAP